MLKVPGDFLLPAQIQEEGERVNVAGSGNKNP
jgi:hypothetical protein